MDTHERREALMGWLRGRPSGTAADAALHFGVTQRTILRDVASLRAQGEPITSCTGPGGGFALNSVARLQAVRLSVEEVLGLALAAGAVGHMAMGLPYGAAARHAVDRLIATLPPERAARFRHLMQRITVGLPEGLRFGAGPDPIEPALLHTLELAFFERRVLSMEYIDRHGQATSRHIEPHGLLLNMPTWYVVAHDRLRGAPRMFRVDRIRALVLREEVFAPRPTSWFEEYLGGCGPSGPPPGATAAQSK